MTPGPTPQEVIDWQMTPEEAAGPDIDVWPDNMPAITLLTVLRGQMRLRPDGLPHALDLAAVTPLVLRACGVTLRQWTEHVMADLLLAASEAIATIHAHARRD